MKVGVDASASTRRAPSASARLRASERPIPCPCARMFGVDITGLGGVDGGPGIADVDRDCAGKRSDGDGAGALPVAGGVVEQDIEDPKPKPTPN